MKEKYTVWFELYGKKMKATVNATTEANAKSIIMSKIKFYKITCDSIPDVSKMGSDDVLNSFKGMFGSDSPFK